ncbi:serine recombinase [Clostridia bacterium]|nr:serine recombinase [Clostridia bacterium]
MSDKPNITVIPATLDREQRFAADQPVKKRVAAYARVSTDLEEQQSSYEAQVDYYTKLIRANPEWVFAGVYADEGISATSTKKRDGFNRMTEDALAGKIDLILTKSVSRFARNTVDTLTNVRRLKEKGVEVYFEKENIYTLDSKGELLITIMSSLAQEESRSISENVTWGQRKRMSDGKVSMCYKKFLGYEKGADGTPQIVEGEAAIIRQIYSLFLGGRTFRKIASHLTTRGVPTPAGKSVWAVTTVRSILKNEKYAGNAILQKSYTVDFLTKKVKVNEGEVTQYYIENSHPAIILPATFELVQDEIRRRGKFGKQISGSGLFTGKVVCGQCGSLYGPKVFHSNDKYRHVIWRCNCKYTGQKCHTPNISEAVLQSVFVRAWNMIVLSKDRYMAEYVDTLKSLTGTAAFDKQTAVLMAECAGASALVQDCIAANARAPQDQESYRKQYDELVARYDAAKEKLDSLAKEKKDRVASREKLRRFIQTLSQTESPLTAFDECLWRETVESVIVYALDDIAVRFHSGSVIRLKAEQ